MALANPYLPIVFWELSVETDTPFQQVRLLNWIKQDNQGDWEEIHSLDSDEVIIKRIQSEI